MVLKKRSSVNAAEEEPKKRRKEDNEEEVSEKKSKKAKKSSKDYVVKVKDDRLSDDDEDVVEEEDEIPNSDIEDKEEADELIQWPLNDMIELFSRIEAQIPLNDSKSYLSRLERVDWEEVGFKNYTPAECKKVWSGVQARLRKYRFLKELITDARQWVHKPWTNFYSAAKNNQHPDMPRRPLTQYMVYYMEKKDKVSAQNPHLSIVEVSKLVARMYQSLPAHKKQKYVAKATELREEYEEKLRQFYEKHPECVGLKTTRAKDSRSVIPGGLKKPRTPQMLFIADRLAKLADDPNFNKHVVVENAKQQWKDLTDKKRLTWINWALEEESKYQDSLKMYMAEHPDFHPPTYKPVLKKEEKKLKDRAAGKPTKKPPNSAYSMYSRIMLSKCQKLRELAPKDRMKEIAVRWSAMPDSEKEEYQKKVKYEQDKYKLEYATYLESLPEDERQEELRLNQTKGNPPKKAAKEADHEFEEEVNNGKTVSKNKTNKASKQDVNVTTKKPEILYYPGEPHQPPVNAFELFVDSFVSDTKLSASEAPRFWEMLPSSDKAKFQRKLKELKEKYIKDYKKFLKSLDEDQVAEYNDLQKRNKERGKASEAEKTRGNESDQNDSDGDDSSDEEVHAAVNNLPATVTNEESDSENEEKKSGSSSGSSSSSSGSSSSSSSSDSDSSSDDSDDDDETKRSVNNIKKEMSESDSSDDE